MGVTCIGCASVSPQTPPHTRSDDEERASNRCCPSATVTSKASRSNGLCTTGIERVWAISSTGYEMRAWSAAHRHGGWRAPHPDARPRARACHPTRQETHPARRPGDGGCCGGGSVRHCSQQLGGRCSPLFQATRATGPAASGHYPPPGRSPWRPSLLE